MVAMFGIFFELLIGIPIGMTSALRQYGFRDRTFTVLSLLFLSMPAFFLGMILMYLFAFKWPIFPLGGSTRASCTARSSPGSRSA